MNNDNIRSTEERRLPFLRENHLTTFYLKKIIPKYPFQFPTTKVRIQSAMTYLIIIYKPILSFG